MATSAQSAAAAHTDAQPVAFTVDQLAAHSRSEAHGPFERRTRWALPGYRGEDVVTELRSGLELYAASCRWERAGAIVADHEPGELSFMISRGPGMGVTIEDGSSYLAAGGFCTFGRIHRAHAARYLASEGAHDEVVCLDVGEARLCELLGASALPASLAGPLSSPGPFVQCSRPMTPDLFRLLDEILYCDAGSAGRQLYLEGKGLELLAGLVDTFEQARRDESPRLTRSDIDRLQRARALLLTCLQEPPSLPALARAARLNEAKLKAGFRVLFGSSVYGYLRRARMEEAYRLLRARELNVTEVACRVGYANPSKFAAAFRRQFGVSPSSV